MRKLASSKGETHSLANRRGIRGGFCLAPVTQENKPPKSDSRSQMGPSKTQSKRASALYKQGFHRLVRLIFFCEHAKLSSVCWQWAKQTITLFHCTRPPLDPLITSKGSGTERGQNVEKRLDHPRYLRGKFGGRGRTNRLAATQAIGALR